MKCAKCNHEMIRTAGPNHGTFGPRRLVCKKCSYEAPVNCYSCKVTTFVVKCERCGTFFCGLHRYHPCHIPPRIMSRIVLYTASFGTCAVSESGLFRTLGNPETELRYRCEVVVRCLIACVIDAGSKRNAEDGKTFISICFPEFLYRGENGSGYYNATNTLHMGDGKWSKPNYSARRQFALSVLQIVIDMFEDEMGRIPYKNIALVACIGTIAVGKGTPSKQVRQAPYVSSDGQVYFDPKGLPVLHPFTKVDNLGLYFIWDQGKVLNTFAWDKRQPSNIDFVYRSHYVYTSEGGIAAVLTHYGKSWPYSPVTHVGGTEHKDPTTHYGAPEPDSTSVKEWIINSSLQPITLGTSICLDYRKRLIEGWTRTSDTPLCTVLFLPSVGMWLSVADCVPNAAAKGVVLHADGSCSPGSQSNVALFEHNESLGVSCITAFGESVQNNKIVGNAERIYDINDPHGLFDWPLPAVATEGGAKCVRFHGEYSL